jgi:hypothetical protein
MERKREITKRGRNLKAYTWDEFECPECTANNPWGDGFEPGEELFCSWCGAVLLVRLIPDSDPPRFRLESQ